MRFILEPPTGIFGANLSHVMTLIHLLYCIVLYGMVWYGIVSCRMVSYRILPITPAWEGALRNGSHRLLRLAVLLQT